MKLLDLVEGLLDEGEAAAVRAHVATCGTCGPAFTQLSESHRAMLTLPLAEPSARVDNAILAMARAKAAGQAVVVPREPAHAAAAGEPWWERWLRALGGFATGPQAAMATVMLLVLAIGVWYLPGSGKDASFGESVLHPGSVSEVPSAQVPSMAPASSEALEGELSEHMGGSAKGASGNAAMNKASAVAAPAEKMARAEDGSGADIGGMRARSTRRMSRAAAPSTAAKSADYASDDLPPPVTDKYESKKDLLAERDDADQIGGLDDGPSRGVASTSQVTATSPAAPAAEASARVASPEALLSWARAAAADGDCKTAVAQYGAYLSRYPSAGARAQALNEQATCYDKLGQLAMAKKARLQAVETEAPAKRAAPKAKKAPAANVSDLF